MDKIDKLFDLLTGEQKLQPAIVFLDEVDKVKKQITYQLWNQIVDCFDTLEKKDKKQRYSAEDVRKKVKAICMKSITSQNRSI